jgi:hypothetical protein
MKTVVSTIAAVVFCMVIVAGNRNEVTATVIDEYDNETMVQVNGVAPVMLAQEDADDEDVEDPETESRRDNMAPMVVAQDDEGDDIDDDEGDGDEMNRRESLRRA